MTKEQSEAIEYFMDKIKDAIPRYTEMLIDGKIIKEEVYQIKMRFDQEDAEKMKTVLNMLKEKDEEIEKLKNKEVLIKRYFKKCDLIKQKDKQIELMAFNLADYVMYYEYDKCRNPEMIKNKAEELKQYFERKVEDECKR